MQSFIHLITLLYLISIINLIGCSMTPVALYAIDYCSVLNFIRARSSLQINKYSQGVCNQSFTNKYTTENRHFRI